MPPQEQHHSHIAVYLTILGAIAVVVVIVYLFTSGTVRMSTQPEPMRQLSVSPMPSQIPEPTGNDLAVAQHRFQYIVSFSGSSFVPLRFSAKAGEVVRFANNASEKIAISIGGMSSPELAVSDYWEYTIPATTTATLIYSANGAAGQITIKK